MKRWQIIMFLALNLLILAGCTLQDKTYTGAPEPQPIEYESPRP